MTDQSTERNLGIRDRAAEDAIDKRIIEKCRQGDRSAYNELIIRYEKRIYNYAYRLSGSYDAANDIASDTFLRVYNSLASFRGDSSFITWLFRVITNIYLDSKKRERARPAQSLDEMIELGDAAVSVQVEDTAPTPAQHAESSERTDLLQNAISSLPDYQRMMIVMYHNDGQSYEEIAEALDMPIGTVKSRLNRARLSLREILEPLKEHFHV
jgi:RNA polymerase sigma-70 factor (ECF subfamily)